MGYNTFVLFTLLVDIFRKMKSLNIEWNNLNKFRLSLMGIVSLTSVILN